MNEDMLIRVMNVGGAEEMSYLDELFQKIQEHVLVLPDEAIDAVIARLERRQCQLELQARQVRSQAHADSGKRCQELERLARRFYNVRYALYRLLHPRHPHYNPKL
jgi:uncharacterized tellurite resistance protein B-like protein